MANQSKLLVTSNAIEKMHQEMLEKTNSTNAGLARDVYTLYANAQRTRWMSEGSSEGDHWEALSPVYRDAKLKRFAAYPGAGKKMLIATGKLYSAVIGDSLEYHQRIITNRTMEIKVTLPYARHVNQERNFTQFSKVTKDKIIDRLKRFYFHE